jgi:hypothetical protein
VKNMCRRWSTNHRRVKTRGIRSNSGGITTPGPLAQGEGGRGGRGGDLSLGREEFAGAPPGVLVTRRASYPTLNNLFNA